ncbi:MAG: Histidine--tRNA ligase [Methanosaeta sp. PtaU1.Bin112]|nr:MAG: Histidine--tRNA ligase [Methanosaeta sp. PtaU1.Bin112]
MTVQRPRGTRDFLPEETEKRGRAKLAMQDVLERWGYREVATPTFEHLELFTIKSGESVIEEIYSFTDKGGRALALRPELTAPVMRMYVSEMQNFPKPQRLWYFGNCFRYERPQRGRFREFWQMGTEIIGGSRPDSEAEAIALADEMLKSLKVTGEIHVGYLGLIRSILGRIEAQHRPTVMRMIDKKERSALAALLEEIGQSHLGLLELIDLKGKSALDKAAQIVGELEAAPSETLNPSPATEPAAAGAAARQEDGRGSARQGRAVVSELRLEQFQETVDLLDAFGVKFTIDFEIVRGLEYYSGTVFEIYAQGLGAQRQICGGGTYELASLFGGKETSSTGFGLGFDRIMEIVQMDESRMPPVFLAFTPDVKMQAAKIAGSLRKSIPLVMDVMGRSLGAQLKAAASAGAEYVVIVGKDELDAGTLTLREMARGEQESLALPAIEQRLKIHFSGR